MFQRRHARQEQERHHDEVDNIVQDVCIKPDESIGIIGFAQKIRRDEAERKNRNFRYTGCPYSRQSPRVCVLV